MVDFEFNYFQAIVLLLSAACLAIKTHLPQVHEVQDDYRQESGTNYQRPAFKYNPTTQRDSLKWRYLQQQLVDAKNVVKFKAQHDINSFKQFAPQWWQVPNISWKSIHRTRKRKFAPLKKRKMDLFELNVRSRRHSRHASDSEAVEDSEMVESNDVKVKIRDLRVHTNYLAAPATISKVQNPAYFKPEKDIDLLNSLEDKHPNAQLQNRQELLAKRPTPTPFQAPTRTDSPEYVSLNPGQSLSELQSQFDALSKVQVASALAQAHQQAAAQVEAQHQAILLAKSQAEKTALDQIQKAQAQALTLSYIQNSHQATPTPIATTPTLNVQQASFNRKLQNALKHVQKQSQIYQHHSLKTHLPQLNKKHKFKEDKHDSSIAATNVDENNDVSKLFTLNSNIKFDSTPEVPLSTSSVEEDFRSKTNLNFSEIKSSKSLDKIQKRSYTKHAMHKTRSKRKRRSKHRYRAPKVQPILVPEKHHYYHFLPAKNDKDSKPLEHKEGSVVVTINNNNNNDEKHKSFTKRRPKQKYRKRAKKHSRHRSRRPNSKKLNKKIHGVFHKLGVPFK